MSIVTQVDPNEFQVKYVHSISQGTSCQIQGSFELKRQWIYLKFWLLVATFEWGTSHQWSCLFLQGLHVCLERIGEAIEVEYATVLIFLF